MKKKFAVLVVLIVAVMSSFMMGCNWGNKDNYVRGVWWWDKSLDIKYLEFASKNNINEIYYCDTSFNEKTESFIAKANEHKMKVYLLAGEKEWLLDDSDLRLMIVDYIAFQEVSKYKYAGIHLDIEPHQLDSWQTNREELIIALIDIVYQLSCDYPEISFTYDIPMWFDDIVTYREVTQEAYKHIIDYADKVVVMSYRDTAEDIYEEFKDEYLYGYNNSTPVMFAVETADGEDIITFKQEGMKALNSAMDTLLVQVSKTLSGVAIHHIKSWYELS